MWPTTSLVLALVSDDDDDEAEEEAVMDGLSRTEGLR